MSKKRRAAGPLALLILVGLVAGAAVASSHARAAAPATAGSTAPAPAEAAAGDEGAATAAIAWLGYEEGLARAREVKRPLLVSFSADWCKFCRRMKAETYTDPDVIAYLSENLVPVMVDTEKRRDVANRYFVRSLPTIWFLDADGNQIANLPGYVDAPTFLKVLQYIGTGSYKDTEFRDFMKKDS